MIRYLVYLEQQRFESAQVHVEANSREEAEDKARNKSGDLDWDIQEPVENSLIVTECIALKDQT